MKTARARVRDRSIARAGAGVHRSSTMLLSCIGLVAAGHADPEEAASALYGRLRAKRYVSLPGRDLWELLSQLGAHEADVESFADFWDEAVPQRDERSNAVYPHKGTLTTYYKLNVSSSSASFAIQRSTSDDATRVPGHVVEHIDPTTVNGQNASYLRLHKQWPQDADSNGRGGQTSRDKLREGRGVAVGLRCGDR